MSNYIIPEGGSPALEEGAMKKGHIAGRIELQSQRGPERRERTLWQRGAAEAHEALQHLKRAFPNAVESEAQFVLFFQSAWSQGYQKALKEEGIEIIL